MTVAQEGETSDGKITKKRHEANSKVETAESELLQEGLEEAPPAEEKKEDEDDVAFPLTSPPISMSAGADPWADPSPVAAMASALSSSNRTTGDNPWASNTLEVEVTESSSSISSKETLTIKPKEQDIIQPDQDERWGEFHLPKFGNVLARYWSWKPGFLQLNSGSYGSCPKPVCDAYKALQDRQEECIDLFRMTQLVDLLIESREKVAKILNCQIDNVVLIANATMGTNAVFRDLVYQDGDAILYTSLTYPAVIDTLDYLIDTEKMRGNQLHKVKVQLDMPMTKEDILATLNSTIQTAKGQGKRIVIGVIDTISSKPGLRLPWQDMVKVLKNHQILSLVDGAHGIGHIPLDLTEADPDFFVSNCHKWLFAHRGCAVFYVPSRNLHLQRSCLPTSHSYMSNPSKDNNTWALQWASPGTLDVSPMLSINAALEFRQMLGGEDRIMNYNHDLAVRGGKAAAAILDTCVLDLPDNSLTASMVNVQVPIIKSRLGPDVNAWIVSAGTWFFNTLLLEFKTVIPIYAYNGNIWARFSAQIWLEVADFEYGARAILELTNRINQGTAPQFLTSK